LYPCVSSPFLTLLSPSLSLSPTISFSPSLPLPPPLSLFISPARGGALSRECQVWDVRAPNRPTQEHKTGWGNHTVKYSPDGQYLALGYVKEARSNTEVQLSRTLLWEIGAGVACMPPPMPPPHSPWLVIFFSNFRVCLASSYPRPGRRTVTREKNVEVDILGMYDVRAKKKQKSVRRVLFPSLFQEEARRNPSRGGNSSEPGLSPFACGHEPSSVAMLT